MVAARRSTRLIKVMQLTHLPDVLYVERESYDYPWSEGIFRDCLRAGYSCLVMEEDGSIVGYGIFQFVAGEAHILNLCVTPSRRKTGCARDMLHGLFSAMKNMGVNTVYLEVRPSNIAAVSLYVSEGFNEVGTRKNYYRAENGKEDALIMARYSDWAD